MPIRKLINDRIDFIHEQVVALAAEKSILMKQRDAFNVDAFAYGKPTSEHDAPEWQANVKPELEAKSSVAKTSMKKAKVPGEPKAPRKPRVESGPRRKGLKADVMNHIMNGDGSASISIIAKALDANLQSVKVAIKGLLTADKIAPSGSGGYHPIETEVHPLEVTSNGADNVPYSSIS